MLNLIIENRLNNLNPRFYLDKNDLWAYLISINKKEDNKNFKLDLKAIYSILKITHLN